MQGLNALDPTKADMQKAFARLDSQMIERGYQGNEGAEDLWKSYRLSPVLKELDIDEPALPPPAPAGVEQGLGLFGAAYAVAKQREAALGR